jgi:hypothetical protein
VEEDLVNNGEIVYIENKDGEKKLDKESGIIEKRMKEIELENGKDLKKIKFKEKSWMGLKKRRSDEKIYRKKGIKIEEIKINKKIEEYKYGE